MGVARWGQEANRQETIKGDDETICRRKTIPIKMHLEYGPRWLHGVHRGSSKVKDHPAGGVNRAFPKLKAAVR